MDRTTIHRETKEEGDITHFDVDWIHQLSTHEKDFVQSREMELVGENLLKPPLFSKNCIVGLMCANQEQTFTFICRIAFQRSFS